MHVHRTHLKSKLYSTAYPQQEKQPPTNPGLPVTGVFDQGARIDPNKPVQIPVSRLLDNYACTQGI